jgi:uncharacterized delta-60 repeat protein
MLKKSATKLSLLVLSLLGISTFAFAQAGSLDPSFGTGGIVTVDFGIEGQSGKATIDAAAIQSDGKIVVAGGIPDGNGHGVASFFVARFLSNGAIDTTFGTKGIAAIAGSDGTYTSVAIQPDGKIVAAGFQVARYNKNGSFDNSFGINGIVTLPEFFFASVVSLQSNGDILVGGNFFDGLGFVGRLLSNGTVDTSFGLGQSAPGFTNIGLVTITSLEMLPDGDILAAGGPNGTVVAALTSTGSLDLNFGLNAQLFTPSATGGLTLGSNGDILVAGTAFTNPTAAGGTGFVLSGYQSVGIADPSFATNGGVITALPNSTNAAATGSGIEPNGRIVVGGNAGVSGQADFVLARYTTSGQLDTSFGTNGTVETSFGGSTPTANGLVIQPADGKIVVFGGLTTVEGGSLDTRLLLARYLAQ